MTGKSISGWSWKHWAFRMRVPNHLVLPLEALTSGATRTAFYGAEMRACVGVDVHVRVEEVLGLEGDGGAAGDGAFETARGVVVVGVGAVVGAGERRVCSAVAVGGVVVLILVVRGGGRCGEGEVAREVGDGAELVVRVCGGGNGV